MGPRFDHPADGPSVSALKHGRARRRVDGWLLAPVAVAGVVLGHSIGYVAAQPNARARAGLLRLTGHVYWNAAVAMALPLAIGLAVGRPAETCLVPPWDRGRDR